MIDLSTAEWRTSSFSNGGFTRAEMDAYIKGVKAGEFDDLT